MITSENIINAQRGIEDDINTLVKHYEKYCVAISKTYADDDHEQFDYLFKISRLGILKSIEKYCFKKNISFDNHTVYWIRNYVRKYAAENNEMHISAKMLSNTSLLQNEILKQAQFDAEPTEADLLTFGQLTDDEIEIVNN